MSRARIISSAGLAFACLAWAAPTFANPPANGQGRLYIVGDSLTVGATEFGSLKSRVNDLDIWRATEIDARFGRKATTGARLISSRIPRSPRVTALVVALGTNDVLSNKSPSYPARLIDLVMARANGLPVLWVNLEFSRPHNKEWATRGVRFNRALDAARTRWPNLFVADWNTYFTPGKVNRFISDGVHLTVAAYRLRAKWLARQIGIFGTAIVTATTTTTTTTSTTTTTTTTIVP